MKTNLRKYLTASLLVLASATSVSMAASNNTTAQKQTQKQTQQAQQPQIKVEVSYYDGDPMKGGKLIKTVTSQPTRGTPPFSDAPDNATFAVVKDPRGSHVIDLSNLPDPAQVPDDRHGGPRGPQGDMNGGPNGGPNGGGNWGGRGQGGPNGGPRGGGQGNLQKPQQGMKGPQDGGRSFLGGSKVTFYDGDPLNGGKVTATFDSNAQKAEIDAAAQKARFAVVEHGNGKVIIDLSKVPAGR